MVRYQLASLAMTSYRELSEPEWRSLPPGSCRHAAHAMLYSHWPGKLFGKYDFKYAILMQLRFDGMIGFPGGLADAGELPEETVTREFAEEVGGGANVVFSPQDHVVTHYSSHTRFCLHFYAKEVPSDQFTAIERAVTLAKHWGDEVMGTIRCPLYTLPNGLGLPAFLCQQFIGNSREQLLEVLRRRALLSHQELSAAIETSKKVNGFVTTDEIDY